MTEWGVVVSLLLVGLLPLESESTCTTTGCLGCGTTIISCSGAQLTEFPRFTAEDAALVEELNLDGNFLTSISVSDLQNFTSLEDIDLSNNEITYIEEGSFSNAVALSVISLNDNPLHCDCKLRWLLDYLDSLPAVAEVDAGTCASPLPLAGSSFVTLNHSQLLCECFPECGNNSSCDLSSGSCDCDPGYSGENCTQVCPLGAFGLNCNTSCTCEAGSCHHITGLCTCFPDYYGVNCSHNCTGAPDCAALGREPCSLSTPEQTCGICRGGSEEEWGNTPCASNTSQLQYTMTSSILMYSQSETIAIPQSSPSPTDDKNADSLPLGLTKTETIAILSVLVVIICLLSMMLFVTLMWKHAFRCQGQKVNPTTSEEKLQGSSDAK